jgi:flagellar hook-length control protein FliK
MIAAAAPAVLDAAPAASSATPGSATSPQAPDGFDAILMMQSLAATAGALDVAALEAGEATDALAAEDGNDEDEGDDLEASLAFLAALLTATAPKDSPGDFAAGAGEQGDEDFTQPLSLKADAGFALGTEGEAAESDALPGLVAVKPELLEPRAPDGSQNLARAAELLLQAQRPMAAEVEKAGLTTHARDPRWADDFSARVSLVVRAGESTASLQMTPMDLGPVEVNVSVKDSQATIHFGASQAETRALLEASLPKLRELLASQGFNLLDASVSSGFSRSQQQAFASNNRASGEAETSTTEARAMRQLGLLDLYA